jgi:hypothetical protein
MNNKPLGEWPRPLEYAGGADPKPKEKKTSYLGNWSYCQSCGDHVHKDTLIKICPKCYERIKEE